MVQNLKRAATIFFVQDGKVLAISRKNNYSDFGLPGGGCEENETFLDAAVRELKEETTLRCYDPKFVFERKDNDHIVQTFKADKVFGSIPSDDFQKKRGEGIVRWLFPVDLIIGSFGEYNKNLFKVLGIMK